MEREFLKRIIEALIFASDEPLSIKQIDNSIDEASMEEINEALTQLNEEYSDPCRAFSLKKVSGGFQFTTKPEYYRWIKRLYEGRIQYRLSRAALETLAIIAFKQPITKVEVSMIRGVNSDGVVKSLLTRKFITLLGRARGPGRPLLYGTTPQFLRYFGLNDLEDLPKPKEIEELMAEGQGATILTNIAENQVEAISDDVLKNPAKQALTDKQYTQSELDLDSATEDTENESADDTTE